MLQRVRRVRLRHDLPGDQRVRDGRPERVLRRRVEGSALHVRGAVARAAVGADGDVSDGRRPDASRSRRSCRSPPTSCGGICRARASSRCTSRCFPSGATLEALIDRELLDRWAKLIARARDGCSPRSSRCGRTSRSAARCRPRWSLSATPAELAAARAVRDAAADAVHRLGGGAAAGAGRRRSARRSGAARHDRARGRREVRALLALRAASVSTEPASAGLCDRCQDALAETVNG